MLGATPEWRATWIKARLSLTHYHPLVAELENAIWKLCVGFAQNPARGRRLVLFGNNGNGKTKTCRAVCRWVRERALELPLVWRDDNLSLCRAKMINWAERVDSLKDGAWDFGSELDSNLLVLDDIGAEHDPSRVGMEKLYLLLERRERMWTIITTNERPEFWESKFERRVADRLFRNADHVDLSELPSYSVSQPG